jgi:hypothetical protein
MILDNELLRELYFRYVMREEEGQYIINKIPKDILEKESFSSHPIDVVIRQGMDLDLVKYQPFCINGTYIYKPMITDKGVLYIENIPLLDRILYMMKHRIPYWWIFLSRWLTQLPIEDYPTILSMVDTDYISRIITEAYDRKEKDGIHNTI